MASFKGRMGVEVHIAAGDADVEALAFPSHNSTTDLPHILAYTSVISTLLHLASSHSPPSLLAWLEALRETAPREPVGAFKHLLTTLGVEGQEEEFWTEYLRPTASSSSSSGVHVTTAVAPSPFDALSTHLTQHTLAQRAQIHTFIARYNSAGGFLPTSRKKVSVLLLADEHARKDTSATPKVKDEGEWLGGVKENVKVGEAWEGEDPAMEKGRRSPELDAGGRLRRDRAVRMALERSSGG
jgi:hypothetical protein